MTKQTNMEKYVQCHEAAIQRIAETLREVGHPVVCAGVDVDGDTITADHGGHTAETICAAILAVRADERERCAAICDAMVARAHGSITDKKGLIETAAGSLATMIRALGEKDDD